MTANLGLELLSKGQARPNTSCSSKRSSSRRLFTLSLRPRLQPPSPLPDFPISSFRFTFFFVHQHPHTCIKLDTDPISGAPLVVNKLISKNASSVTTSAESVRISLPGLLSSIFCQVPANHGFASKRYQERKRRVMTE